MPRIITGSPNIASLDFFELSDLCEGIFTVNLSPTIWIGAGASNVLGASFKITNPLDVIIKNYPTSGYDIYPPMTEDVEVNIPTQASNYQYGTYNFEVSLTDADGTIYIWTKPVKIVAPNSKNKTVNYGSLSATLDGNCETGRVTIIADTPPNYQGFTTDSQVNDFTLLYPTVSEVEPEETTQNNFSVQLYEGEYRFTGTICAHYSLGDNVTANVNYRVKRYKTIYCLLDKACVAARLSELQFQISQDCKDSERIATQATIINALLLLTVIDSRATTGLDPSDAIAELQEVLGCECTCNCAEGTPVIPLNPTGDFVVEGCNVTSETTGLTTTYTIGENYAYRVEIAPNGGAITVSAPTIVNCLKSQVITFTIGTVYTQIKEQINSGTERNFWASIINYAWNNLDLTCIGTPLQWSLWTFAQRSQWLFDRLCAGSVCEAVIADNETEAIANDVVVDWVNTSDVYEVAVYMDDILVGTVLNPTSTFTIIGAADGDEHEYVLVSKCTNGSQGAVLRGEFEYFGCPAIAVPTVSDTSVVDATCPYDLTALVSGLPIGITQEWHNLNNTSASSLVPDPTGVTGGTYFVFAKNAGGCYSIGVQVILTCSTDTACSAPQNLIVETITGDFRVRFQSAAYPPPLNSYTVKRRLTSAPDVSGSYTTIGTPTWNASDSVWEILDTTGIDNTLYTYRAVSNCTSSAPTIDYIFANLTCPTVTLTPGDTTMGYSFTNSGGGIDKYEVRIYDATGVTLIHTDTKTPAFATPITGTFIYLDEGTTYLVSLKIFIGTYSSVCPNTVGTTDQPDTISPPTYMNLANPSFSGTIEVTTVGGRTLRFTTYSLCGVASASITISGGVGTINNNISTGVSNDTEDVDTVIPVGSYTYTGTLTAGCTSTASILFI